MYIGTSVATEEHYANFLALDAGNNPLLQVRPTWVELVTQGKVEDGKVAIMVYPEHVSYIRPSDLDAMHESGELEVVPDVYSTVAVVASAPGFGNENADLAKELRRLKGEIERALELMEDPDVDLVYVDFDHHDGGSTILNFETADAAKAEEYGFEQVLRAGADNYEDTPWTKTEAK
jgi:hypothetical protein